MLLPSCGPDNPQTVYRILNAIDYIRNILAVDVEYGVNKYKQALFFGC